MGERSKPEIYSIAAHRGFADALVAGLVPRYAEPELGLAGLTLLVPSTRAARTIGEAFTRQLGEGDGSKMGMLLPRMVTVGDLDLDEALGSLLDPLGCADIPRAADPTHRWLELARLIELELKEQGKEPVPGPARFRLARDLARAMDRLLVEERLPQDLLSDAVLDELKELSSHWQRSIRLFARVQARWQAQLAARGGVDAATRRNLLFDRARRRWRDDPPPCPIIAAGVTSAAPALARLLRTIAELPQGAVILPDLDLAMDEQAWDELGRAGGASEAGGAIFAAGDALAHPQYHLKLLLSRMGVARQEVQPWHRRGMSAAQPARSRAISSLFLPPQASLSWVGLSRDQRQLAGVRLMTTATIEEEAQAIALMVRQALEVPEKRVSVISADRAIARRVTQHLARWNIEADDTAGRPLSLTPPGRLVLLLAELAAHGPRPVGVIAALGHPLVEPERRGQWLANVRRFEQALRGPEPAPGFEPLREVAARAGVVEWWAEAEALLRPLCGLSQEASISTILETLMTVCERLAGTRIWGEADGRSLAGFLEDLRHHADRLGSVIAVRDAATTLRDAMDEIAVRPPYGGHPRIAIYGLLESRMTRSDLVICAGLNEGTWPQVPAGDAFLAPAILRKLGVPGAEFRIGLSAHDLAGAMGAPEVVLSRALRDAQGPTRPSRFLLRVEALLGEALAEKHTEREIVTMLPLIDRAPSPAPRARRPQPDPVPELRKVKISATALDRLLGDPFQFYAREILGLRKLDPLAADPFEDHALRGTLVHDILDRWHKQRRRAPDCRLLPFAEGELLKTNPHPLLWGLWRPRLMAALARFEQWIEEAEAEGRRVLASEAWGSMSWRGVSVSGRADRIDLLPNGTLALVDYKTGKAPTKKETAAGYRLQLGVLGLIARDGEFRDTVGDGTETLITGDVSAFEYWSLRKCDDEYGERSAPLKLTSREGGLAPEDFLPLHEARLNEAIDRFILGRDPFTAKENPDYPGYTDYDQLMRLEEWAYEAAASGDES
ncbi:MAG: double-strand break repair protein AddB [Erythrobacter sp.]|nr:double-strand break repair protein AddB [Erythrobacter sp.]